MADEVLVFLMRKGDHTFLVRTDDGRGMEALKVATDRWMATPDLKFTERDRDALYRNAYLSCFIGKIMFKQHHLPRKLVLIDSDHVVYQNYFVGTNPWGKPTIDKADKYREWLKGAVELQA